jgi:polar amino acid transport system substrate-binding protein
MRAAPSALRRLHALCLLACLLATLAAAGAELRIDTIAVAPFGYMGKDGKPTGMMVEIGNLIAAEAGFSSRNQLVPYARTVVDLEYGKVDLVLRFNNAELPRVAHQLGTVVTMHTVLLARAGTPMRALEDLRGKTVGELRGGHFDLGFARDAAIIKYPLGDYQHMLQMLMVGRLDAAIGSDAGLFHAAKALGIAPSALSAPLVLSSQPFVLHVSRKTATPETMAALSAALERLKRSGAVDAVVQRYQAGDPAPARRH